MAESKKSVIADQKTAKLNKLPKIEIQIPREVKYIATFVGGAALAAGAMILISKVGSEPVKAAASVAAQTADAAATAVEAAI